ncbi:hypothetical protein K470DRAFT_257036 [Piedraia hortae CBS 480.64]|uniref:Uncharacterized protein n=1 Tax=Piedraia hortae CBS 480.64 TaxID=1314780 RepID=A0A6A7C1C4_9PEZI|nr:hypothetical protein K470DRAFT_257036 [Piedraia hortae CBS 480.64]
MDSMNRITPFLPSQRGRNIHQSPAEGYSIGSNDTGQYSDSDERNEGDSDEQEAQQPDDTQGDNDGEIAASQREVNDPEVVSNFREAARSVTTLFRSGLDAQKRARAAGYQDTLGDLLRYIDQHNIGHVYGTEGWKIRQWILARLLLASQREQSGTGRVEEEDSSGPSQPERRSPPPNDDSSDDEMSGNVQQRFAPQPSLQARSPRQVAQTPRPPHRSPTSRMRDIRVQKDAHSKLVKRSKSSILRQQRRSRSENRPKHINLGTGTGTKRRSPFVDVFADPSTMSKKGRYT